VTAVGELRWCVCVCVWGSDLHVFILKTINQGKVLILVLSCDIPVVLDTIRWYRKYSRNTANKVVK